MLPSIDKANRHLVLPKSNQVRKIDPTDQVHPRDYGYEMEQILDQEEHHPKQNHAFGEDTFEPSEETEQEKTSEEIKPDPTDTSNTSNHDPNIDITV